MYVRTFEPNERMHDNEACDVYRLIMGGVPVHLSKAEVHRRMKLWVEANEELENE
jgi:hypothetical protein